MKNNIEDKHGSKIIEMATRAVWSLPGVEINGKKGGSCKFSKFFGWLSNPAHQQFLAIFENSKGDNEA